MTAAVAVAPAPPGPVAPVRTAGDPEGAAAFATALAGAASPTSIDLDAAAPRPLASRASSASDEESATAATADESTPSSAGMIMLADELAAPAPAVPLAAAPETSTDAVPSATAALGAPNLPASPTGLVSADLATNADLTARADLAASADLAVGERAAASGTTSLADSAVVTVRGSGAAAPGATAGTAPTVAMLADTPTATATASLGGRVPFDGLKEPELVGSGSTADAPIASERASHTPVAPAATATAPVEAADAERQSRARSDSDPVGRPLGPLAPGSPAPQHPGSEGRAGSNADAASASQLVPSAVTTTTPPAPARVEAAGPATTTRVSDAFAAQLTRPIRSVASSAPGTHELTIRVTPEHLGPVSVRATVSPEGVRIELLAPGETGREALRHVLGDLRRDIVAAGLTATLDVSPRDAGAGAGAGAGTGHGAGSGATAGHGATTSDQPPSRDPRRAPDHPSDPTPGKEPPAPHAGAAASTLDVIA